MVLIAVLNTRALCFADPNSSARWRNGN